MSATAMRSPEPANDAHGYQSQDRYHRPIERKRPNFIPAQSWLHYNWTDKDPELDYVCSVIEGSGLTIEKIEKETEKHGHKVSRFTIYNWLYGGTKRPHNVTMNTVMSALGYERTWLPRGRA